MRTLFVILVVVIVVLVIANAVQGNFYLGDPK